MKKAISLALCTLMLVSSLSINVSAASKLPFTDVTENNWYYQNLVELYGKNIIAGFPDGTFKGTSPLMKDQLLKLIITTVNSHADYTKQSYQKWFEPYLAYCRMMGIEDYPNKVTSTDDAGNTFEHYETEDVTKKYNVEIKREDVAKYVAKALELGVKAMELPEGVNLDLKYSSSSDEKKYFDEKFSSIYNDASSISSECKSAIAIMYQTGIMQGDDKGNFNPKGSLTRAEATAIIYRLRKARVNLTYNENIDYDKLVNIGYVYSKGHLEEQSNKNNEALKDLVHHNDAPIFTVEQIEDIFSTNEKFFEFFPEHAEKTGEELEEIKAIQKELMLKQYGNYHDSDKK
ncbi:MAG: S-layer homology domain-containing protein [Clostridia bacterium]|nr:S-layer homology domain-containing protein [Clostridia bacterium]